LHGKKINIKADESDREEESTSDDMMDEPVDQRLSWRTVEDGQLSSHQKQQQKVCNRSHVKIIINNVIKYSST